MEKYFAVLRQVPLFQGIEQNQLASLLKCLDGMLAQYPKNRSIMRAGQPVGAVGIVCEGQAQIVRDDITGNRTILASLGPGEIFAEVFACAQVEKMPVSVIAVRKSVILKINYHRILNTCSTACLFHNKMLENMLRILANKNLALNLKHEIISMRSMREKLKAYLLAQAKKTGARKFTIPFNRQELADYLAVERSALSRELGNMQKQGLIKFHKNEFEILG